MWRHKQRPGGQDSWLSCPGAAAVAEILFHISTAELCGNPALSQQRHKQLMQVTNCEKRDFQTSSAFFGLKAEAKWKEAQWHHSDRQHPVAHRTPCLLLESDTMCHWRGKKPRDCLLLLFGGVNKLQYSPVPSWFRRLTRICFSNMAAGTWPQIINIQLSSSTLAHLQGSKTWISWKQLEQEPTGKLWE